MDWLAVRVTLQLATATTAILFVVGVPLAAWLSSTRVRFRFVLEAMVALPLVLPPTVLGFYLLWATGPRSILGGTWRSLTGSTLPFSFGGILVGSILFNLPFAVRPFVAAIGAVDRRLVEAAWCLGVSRLETFLRITVPLAWRGILAGIVLTFAHAMGEFGVVLMVGGNIPGVTRTLSIAIYDDVQSLNYQQAGTTALAMLAFSFTVLCVVQSLSRNGAAA